LSLKTRDIEIAIANHFGHRQNIIVPNVSWGAGFNHECDILIIRPSGAAIEIEIKISAGDLKRDKDKQHQHNSRFIRQLFFAIPEFMRKYIEHVPEKAGILIVKDSGKVETVRPAKINKSFIKMNQNQVTKIAHLGTMRIWSLKEKNRELKNKLDSLAKKEKA